RVEPRSGVEPPDLRQSAIADGALAVRRPLERGIVDDHRHVVLREADIELEPACPESDRLTKRVQCVLGRESGRAAVPDDFHSRDYNRIGRSSVLWIRL